MHVSAERANKKLEEIILNIRLSSLDEAKQQILALWEMPEIKKEKGSVGFSPYQMLVHCAKTIEYSMTGYPSLKPALIRYVVGRPVIRRFLKQGYMKHDLAADVPGSPAIDDVGTFQDGIQELMDAIDRFTQYDADLKPHLLFGKLSKEAYDRYFAIHIADHLSEL